MSFTFLHRIRLGIFLLISTVVLVFSISTTPRCYGDGHEYLIMAQAFLNHATPNIRVGDIVERQQQIASFSQKDCTPSTLAGMKSVVSLGIADEPGYGLFHNKQGDYYSFHFWLYPAYVAIIEAIIKIVGVNPFAAFQIANSLLIIAISGYVLFKVKGTLTRQLAIIFAFILGGSLFYLKWTHPEFFIAIFLFIGFIVLYQRLYSLSLLSLAIVAIQVVSLWAVFIVIPLLLFLQDRQQFYPEITKLAKQWSVWLFCILPIASPLFYYLNFGKISLIGAICTDIALISWSHLYSFWFDLDQGVIVGVPWLLPVVLIFLIGIKNASPKSKLDFLIAVFASLIICIPLLAQTNVNSGQSVFQRYALYAVCPITAWAGYYFLDIVQKKYLQLILLIISIAYSAIFSGPKAIDDSPSHKPWTKFILEHFPDSYNPEPGVFFARGIPGHPQWSRYSDRMAVYRNQQGAIRKVLFPIDKAEVALANFCEGQLVDEQGGRVDFTKGTHQAYGWAYINGVMHCDGLELDTVISLPPQYSVPLLSGIDFSRDGFPEWVEFATGLSAYEGNGRWSNGNAVILKLKAPIPERFSLNLMMSPFAENLGKTIKVDVNGVSNSILVDSKDPKNYPINVVLPTATNEAIIKIIIAKPISPEELGISGDPRKLGLYFSKIGFDF